MRSIFMMLALSIAILVGCAKPTDPSDISNREKGVLSAVAEYATVGEPYDMIVSDDYIFIAEDQGGFSIHNRETKALKSRINVDPFNDPYVGIRTLSYVEGTNTLYVWNRINSSVIHSWDVEDPSEPVHLGNWAGDGVANVRFLRCHINENEEIVAAMTTRIREFRYGTFELWFGEIAYNDTRYYPPNEINTFDVQDDFYFFSGSQRGMYVLDLSNRNFTELNLTGDALDIAVQGNYAYIVAKQEGLLVVNIEDPLNPEWVYSISTSGWAQSVAVEGDYLAVASGGGGVYLYDISETPEQPKLLDRMVDTYTDYALLVELSNGSVFVAGRYKGITEFKINR